MPHYVALLRGINVGGKHKLPMADLASIFADAGGTSVRTYIQSGNVLFEATAEAASRMPTAVAAAIQASFGYRVPVVLRSASELTRALEGNPFLARGVPANELHVAFLAGAPNEARVAALDPHALRARRLRGARTRDLPPPAERGGTQQAHQRLLRSRARHHL